MRFRKVFVLFLFSSNVQSCTGAVFTVIDIASVVKQIYISLRIDWPKLRYSVCLAGGVNVDFERTVCISPSHHTISQFSGESRVQMFT